MSTMHTRVATLADLNAIAPLFDAYRQFYLQPPDLALSTRFVGDRMLNHESVVLLAIHRDAGVIGFCQLYPSFCSVEAKPIFVLYDLFVAPEARRTGAGRALLLAAEQHAIDTDKARMDLSTARINTRAQALYESLGWIRDKVFYSYSKYLSPLE